MATQLAYKADRVGVCSQQSQTISKTVGGDTARHVLDLAAALPVVNSGTDVIYLYGLDIIAEQMALRQGSGQAHRYY